ncbi:nicotinate-nucleotide diphosphorylase (carboxylating) [Cytophagales bacterium WSM2-2]|nr:nicotinate-nucleotide diphosphorylase (carboxylating) [Cytophagales bacterium WSM2-2]
MITIDELIKQAFAEDIADGDHTTLATVDKNIIRKARLLVKENGMIAGVDFASKVFDIYDTSIKMETFIKDGALVKKGDIAFVVEGKAQSILTAERLALNIMQRMSGIATKTHKMNELIKDTNCKLLDTRKTTPNFRIFEKEAVKIGGGFNLRFGLFDMILIKDNHVDYSGGIKNALNNTLVYLKLNNKNLKIEIEVRNIAELKEVLSIGGVHRILIDNFDAKTLKDAVALVKEYNANHDIKIDTEASGGINETNIREYALTGVDFISLGALTHSYKSLDLSLKAYNG